MARVAVAYVEVRPDLDKFGALLKEKLDTAATTVAIKAKADTKSAIAAGKKTGDVAGKAAGQAMPRTMVEHFKAESGKLKKQLAAETSVNTAYAASQAAKAMRARLRPDQLISDRVGHALAQRLTKMFGTAGAQAANAMVREHNAGIRRMEADRKRASDRQIRDARKDADRLARETARATERAARDARRNADRDARAAKDRWDTVAKQMRLGLNLKLGQWGPILGAAAVAAAPLAKIVTSLAAGVAALGAATLEAAAAIGAAGVSALIAFGQAAGVAVFATHGLGDALKALTKIQDKVAAGLDLTQGELDNYAEAMAKLSPAARDVVLSLGSVNGAFVTMRKTVQQALFVGMGQQIQQLANVYLPMLQTQMVASATVLNKLGASVAAYAAKASTVGRVNAIMAGNTNIVASLGQAIVPLADAALRLTAAFQPLGQMLARYVAGWADASSRSLIAAEASGKLKGFVDGLGNAMMAILRVAGSVGRALSSTFSALLGPGRQMLGMVDLLAKRWADWAASVAGRNAITAWANEAIPVLSALGRLVGDVFGVFNRLAQSGDAAGFVDQLRQILPPLENLLRQLSASNAAGKFAEALGSVGDALASINAGGALANAVNLVATLLTGLVRFVSVVPGMSVAIGGLVNALAILAALRFTATLTGLRMLPGFTISVINFTKALRGMALAEGVAATGAARLGTMLNLTVVAHATTMIKTFSAGLALMRLELIATTGVLATTRAAVIGLSIALAESGVGLIILGIGAVAGAIWGISAASQRSKDNVAALNVELRKVGATTTMGAVAADMAHLAEIANAYNAVLKQGSFLSEADRAAMVAKRAEVNEMAAAYNQMADVYGRNIDSIIGNLRSWGVASTTSTGEILVAMQRVQAANGGVALSTEEMSTTLAAIYGVMGKDYGAMANTFSALNQQIANGYGVVSEAALDAAQAQIQAQLLALKVVGGMGGYAERELNAQISGIENYRKALQAQTQQTAGYGAGLSDALAGAGAKATAAAKRSGMKTGAGWITSFNAAISDLKASDLLGKSASWTKIGSNITTYLAKGMTSGAKNIANVSKYIGKNFKGNIAAIQKEIANYRKALTVYDPVTAKQQGREFWEDRLNEIKSFKASVQQSLMAGADLVNWFGYIPTAGEVKKRLSDLLDQQLGFTSKLAKLQERGLDKDLAKAWLEAGYDTAGNLVEGLTDATDEEVAAISAQFKTLSTNAKTVADTQATKYYQLGQSQVEQIIKGIDSKTAAASAKIQTLLNTTLAGAKTQLNWTKLGEQMMDQYNTGVTNSTPKAKTTLLNSMTTVNSAATTKAKLDGEALGKAVMQGYAKGIKDQEAKTHEIIQNTIKNIAGAGRNAQKSKSPSKLWADIGAEAMAGYAEGIASGQVDAVTAASTAVNATANVPRPGYATAGTLATAGASQPPMFNVRVFIGDRELTDIVNVVVDNADSTRARALYTGRR